MDKIQKVVVVLLVVTILLSVVSLVLNFSILGIETPKKTVNGQVSKSLAGNIEIVVEGNDVIRSSSG